MGTGQHTGGVSVAGAAASEPGAVGRYIALAVLAIALAVAIRWAPRARRPVVDAAVAIALPMVGALVFLAMRSPVANDKYLAHVLAACGAIFGAAVGLVASWINRVATRGDTRAGRVTRALDRLVPYAAAAYIVARTLVGAPSARRDDRLTFAEAAAVSRELATRGFTYARAYRALKSPDIGALLASFDVVAPSFPTGAAGDDPTNVYVAKIATPSLPRTLPKDWIVAAQSESSSLVMIFTRSFLSWDHFDACDGSGECIKSGLALKDDTKPACAFCVPGMPPVEDPKRRTLELRIPLVASSKESGALAMPRRVGGCSGRIAKVIGRAVEISPDGSHATWSAVGDGEVRAEARMIWELGSPECDFHDYSGLPPFFIEGERETVEMIERLGM
jgi:hypothetical protein